MKKFMFITLLVEDGKKVGAQHINAISKTHDELGCDFSLDDLNVRLAKCRRPAIAFYGKPAEA